MFLFGVVLKIVDIGIALKKDQIVHNDIKPANLLMRDESIVVLGDFGSATEEESGENLYKGNFVTMAPEFNLLKQ